MDHASLQLNNRKETLTILERLHKKGYRYVARDDYPYLICFSLKPKKFKDIESWGYIDPKLNDVLPAYPIKNEDVTEINWNNRSAILITDFIANN